MAERKGNKKEAKKGLKNFDVTVTRAYELKSGDILFDAVINEIALYGMGVKKSEKGDWISYPSRKGQDDKYYKHFWLNLDEAQTDELIQAVFDKLDE